MTIIRILRSRKSKKTVAQTALDYSKRLRTSLRNIDSERAEKNFSSQTIDTALLSDLSDQEKLLLLKGFLDPCFLRDSTIEEWQTLENIILKLGPVPSGIIVPYSKLKLDKDRRTVQELNKTMNEKSFLQDILLAAENTP